MPTASKTDVHAPTFDERYWQFKIENLDDGESFSVEFQEPASFLWFWPENVSGAAYRPGDLIIVDDSGEEDATFPEVEWLYRRPRGSFGQMGYLRYPGLKLAFRNTAQDDNVITAHILAFMA